MKRPEVDSPFSSTNSSALGVKNVSQPDCGRARSRGRERIFIELMMSDRKLKVSQEGSK